jgi:hypothetical protein
VSLLDDYHETVERERRRREERIAWEARQEAFDALGRVIMAAGGTVRVPRATRLLDRPFVLYSEDPLTGDEVWQARETAPEPEPAELLRRLDAWEEGDNPGPLIRWAAAHLRGEVGA